MKVRRKKNRQTAGNSRHSAEREDKDAGLSLNEFICSCFVFLPDEKRQLSWMRKLSFLFQNLSEKTAAGLLSLSVCS